MGCSASRFDTIIAKAIEDPSPSYSTTTCSSSSSSSSSSTSKSSSYMRPKTQSLSIPLVHHPALNKGDTHHLVSLTSTTYGSLVVNHKSDITNYDNSNTNDSPFVENDGFVHELSPHSVINTWELMEGLEDSDVDNNINNSINNEVNVCNFVLKSSTLCDFEDEHKLPNLSDFKVKSSSLCDFDDAQKLPTSNLCDFELGLNMVDPSSDFMVKSSSLCHFNDEHKMHGSRLGFHFNDSWIESNDSYDYVGTANEIVEVEEEEEEMGFELSPSTKPLWEHLSKESLLSKMDPYVSNAYESALLAKKFGGQQSSKESYSARSSLFVSKSKNMGWTSPVVTKLASDDKVVLYFTSLRGIRKTYEDCATVRTILRGFRVVVDERDISMDSSYRKELQSALIGKAMCLPQLFIRGKHIGGVDDVKLLHETGELESILEGCPTKDCGSECPSCGDARFVPCSNCYGSQKVFQEDVGRTRKCPDCNENGLIRCPGCCP